MKHLFALLLLISIVPIVESAERPNIVVILCDDLGWGDLQNYGHPHIKTPRLLKLAEQGIQFSNFYSAAPVCSPSRVGLLTGRIPNRSGVYDWIPDANPAAPVTRSQQLVEMRRQEFTIPQMLQAAGYATCMSGKWHCNAMFNSDKQAQPGDHGFDHWFATQNNAAPSHENPRNFVRNGEQVGQIEGYSCQIVADEAISWLEQHHKEEPEQPFFIYMAFHEPHEPVASPPELVAKYKDVARNVDEAHYFANVENLDSAAGKLLDALDRLKVSENTLVVFTSDNGPETLNRYPNAKRSYGTPGHLRGMKLHTHDAGFHVAGIMRWPAKIAGGTKCDVPVSSLDLLPTFAQLSGGQLPDNRIFDGTSILSVFEGNPVDRARPLLWAYYNSYDGKTYLPTVAMRDGNMKVRAIVQGLPKTDNIDGANVMALQNAVLGDFEIYDLSDDPSEQHRLPLEGSPLPEKLSRLHAELLKDCHIWPAVKK
ncbi:MAG: sulfatase-like hydrolase/transferase [Planctomycetaceae bacterium]|nr:sulfatase-like hydrolase/transferase [Planctomycetaceae bacterium]MCB9950880.1 sulfatase-like hydrolase/transferase [Planctomycetaceae bacterium]